MWIPSEGGQGWEKVYVFTDPDHPHRSLEIETKYGYNLDENLMDGDDQTWSQQGQRLFEAKLQMKGEGNLASLLNTQSLTSLESLLSSETATRKESDNDHASKAPPSVKRAASGSYLSEESIMCHIFWWEVEG